MSIYTTPLQFGYFMALLFAVLFWIRGSREERLADTLMGWLMLLLNQMLQDYTFGFAGINVLWNELHGFPRGVGLLLGPAVYFYLRAQTNRNFKLQLRNQVDTDIKLYSEGLQSPSSKRIAPNQGGHMHFNSAKKEESLNNFQQKELNNTLSIQEDFDKIEKLSIINASARFELLNVN